MMITLEKLKEINVQIHMCFWKDKIKRESKLTFFVLKKGRKNLLESPKSIPNNYLGK